MITLRSPPTDGISSVTFAPTCNMLLTTSWDSTVRLHDVDANVQRSKYEHSEPVLDGCFGVDESYVFTGGLDSIVKMHHFESGNEDTLGRHEKPVRCLEYCTNLNVTVSGSWDGTVKLWDIREKKPLVGDFQQKGKVFTMSLVGKKLVVGTSGGNIDVWDLRDTKEPLQERKSPLKHMTRVIRCFPNQEGFALGSVEGRVAIEHFSSEKKKANYAFKCHRKKDAEGNTIVYPVNALAVHPTFGTFASGGCDGTVAIWDGANKKRLCQLPQHPMGISSMDFNHDGTLLAVASSYTFEEGEKDGTSENIFVHSMKEGQVRPKKKKKKS